MVGVYKRLTGENSDDKTVDISNYHLAPAFILVIFREMGPSGAPPLAHPKSPNYKTPAWSPLKIALEGRPITTIDLAKFRARPMWGFFSGYP